MRKGGVLGKRPLLGKHAQDKNIPRKAKGGTTVTGEWSSKQIMDLVQLQIGTHIDSRIISTVYYLVAML